MPSNLPDHPSPRRAMFVGFAMVVMLLTTTCSGRLVSGEAGATPAGTMLPAGAAIRPSTPSATLAALTPNPTTEAAKKQPCRGLESTLYWLTQAPDPAANAASNGVVGYQNGTVKVIVQLVQAEGGGSKRQALEHDLASRYGLTEVDSIGAYFVGRAPVGSLCDVAGDARVRFVAGVQRAITP